MWILLNVERSIILFFVHSWRRPQQACLSQRWRSVSLRLFTPTQCTSDCSATSEIQTSSSMQNIRTFMHHFLLSFNFSINLSFYFHFSKVCWKLKFKLFFWFHFLLVAFRSIPVAWRSDFVPESKEAESKMASLKKRMRDNKVKVTEKWVILVIVQSNCTKAEKERLTWLVGQYSYSFKTYLAFLLVLK